jgi:hypothetical protein
MPNLGRRKSLGDEIAVVESGPNRDQGFRGTLLRLSEFTSRRLTEKTIFDFTDIRAKQRALALCPQQ